MKQISRFIFWVLGWQTKGVVPQLNKFVVIAAPHTSGWDMLFGLCAKYIFGIRFTFFAKKELFFFPFGNLLRFFGGIPVDRSSKNNVVQQAVEMFEKNENFFLALSPEGTRKYAPEWRTGFYFIALQAKVPIVLSYLDYGNKTVGIGPTRYPTGDVDKDIGLMKDFYRPISGKHPEKGVL